MKIKARFIFLLIASMLLVGCEDGDFNIDSHTVTYLNYDGSILYTTVFNDSETGTYDGTTPEKPSSTDNSYKFTGWSNPIIDINDNKVYKAQFDTMATVIFRNYDNVVLYSTTIKQGNTAIYDGKDPVKASNSTSFVYSFARWDKSLINVQKNMETTAIFNEVNVYSITFVNYDNTVLQSGYVKEGEVPKYTGKTPTKPDESSAYFDFSGWSPEITAVTGNKTYVAQYSIVENEFDPTIGATVHYYYDSETKYYSVDNFEKDGLTVNVRNFYDDGVNGRRLVTKFRQNPNYFDENYNPTINLPSTITSFLNYGSFNAKAYNVSSKNKVYASVDGVIYTKDLTEIIAFPGGKTGWFTIPDYVKKINPSSFNDANLSRISIGKNVKSLIDNPFVPINTLTYIEVDEGNEYFCDVNGILFNKDKTILMEVPRNYGISSYIVPNTVKELGMGCLYGLNLTSLVFDDNLEKISAYALCNAKINSLNLTKNISLIENIGLSGLKTSSVTIDKNNKYYSCIDNILYSFDGKELVYYPCLDKRTKLIVPSHVEEILEQTIRNQYLQTIIISSGVKKIGYCAIDNCKNVKDIYVPLTVVTIEHCSFCYLNSNTIIHCEATEKPSGWVDYWTDSKNVLWGETMPTE